MFSSCQAAFWQAGLVTDSGGHATRARRHGRDGGRVDWLAAGGGPVGHDGSSEEIGSMRDMPNPRAFDLPPFHLHVGPLASGNARILDARDHPRDGQILATRDQIDRPFVVQRHVRPDQPNSDCLRAHDAR